MLVPLSNFFIITAVNPLSKLFIIYVVNSLGKFFNISAVKFITTGIKAIFGFRGMILKPRVLLACEWRYDLLNQCKSESGM